MLLAVLGRVSQDLPGFEDGERLLEWHHKRQMDRLEHLRVKIDRREARRQWRKTAVQPPGGHDEENVAVHHSDDETILQPTQYENCSEESHAANAFVGSVIHLVKNKNDKITNLQEKEIIQYCVESGIHDAIELESANVVVFGLDAVHRADCCHDPFHRSDSDRLKGIWKVYNNQECTDLSVKTYEIGFFKKLFCSWLG